MIRIWHIIWLPFYPFLNVKQIFPFFAYCNTFSILRLSKLSVNAEVPPASLLRTFELKLWIFNLFMPEEVVLLHSHMALMYCGFLSPFIQNLLLIEHLPFQRDYWEFYNFCLVNIHIFTSSCVLCYLILSQVHSSLPDLRHQWCNIACHWFISSLIEPFLPMQVYNLTAAPLISQGFWKDVYPAANYRDRYTSCWFTGYLLIIWYFWPCWMTSESFSSALENMYSLLLFLYCGYFTAHLYPCGYLIYITVIWE